jgi:chemotaxis response regulator CheB
MEDAPAGPAQPGVSGAVVVLAGIGGPDAVRQFLGALPEGFPRPVLVRQRLDGGRHDRLVRQLQRATPLPVELAEAGLALVAGHVYIVPDGVATEAGDTGSRFVESTGEVGPLAGLPVYDSAIVLLSGADPAQVDEVMALAEAGALVAGQSPEESFDNAAPGAAIARGAGSGSPSQLAERVAGRWTA